MKIKMERTCGECGGKIKGNRTIGFCKKCQRKKLRTKGEIILDLNKEK